MSSRLVTSYETSDITSNDVPSPPLETPYPLIDCDPHVKRVFKYARAEDWALGVFLGTLAPIAYWYTDKKSPALVPRRSYMAGFRLSCFIGLTATLLITHRISWDRFLGFRENKREQERDMREMVAKVKSGEPLYGKSRLSEYMQGVAARGSRYGPVMAHLVPIFNFVNHPYHGVDTAKYYQQAELELEAEKDKLTTNPQNE